MSAKNLFENIDLSKFDVTKMMQELNIPGINMQAMMDAQRKNIEAVVAANKVAIEGMQAVAKRQAEILAETMAAVSKSAQEMTNVSNPQELTSKQAELTRQALEKALSNMRELAEMVGKSNTEAFQVINTRLNESLADLKGLVEVQKK